MKGLAYVYSYHGTDKLAVGTMKLPVGINSKGEVVDEQITTIGKVSCLNLRANCIIKA